LELDMKKFAIIAFVAALAACGSDNGPSDKFTGTWSGDAVVSPTDTLHFVFTPAQNGSAVTGSGIISSGGDSEAFTFSGTSTPPSVNLTLQVGSEALAYTGTYIKSDSLAGAISEGSTSIVLDLKKN
jgi:type 1 fimbria pilin